MNLSIILKNYMPNSKRIGRFGICHDIWFQSVTHLSKKSREHFKSQSPKEYKPFIQIVTICRCSSPEIEMDAVCRVILDYPSFCHFGFKGSYLPFCKVTDTTLWYQGDCDCIMPFRVWLISGNTTFVMICNVSIHHHYIWRSFLVNNLCT